MPRHEVRNHYDDFDPADMQPDVKVLSGRHHTARKEHTCNTCEGRILPGQKYDKTVMIFEGEFQIHKRHVDTAQCRAAGEARIAWEAEQEAIMVDIMADEMLRETATDCWRCGGSGAVGYDLCPICGGAGRWDCGEDMPAALDTVGIEPRIHFCTSSTNTQKQEPLCR